MFTSIPMFGKFECWKQMNPLDKFNNWTYFDWTNVEPKRFAEHLTVFSTKYQQYQNDMFNTHIASLHQTSWLTFQYQVMHFHCRSRSTVWTPNPCYPLGQPGGAAAAAGSSRGALSSAPRRPRRLPKIASRSVCPFRRLKYRIYIWIPRKLMSMLFHYQSISIVLYQNTIGIILGDKV